MQDRTQAERVKSLVDERILNEQRQEAFIAEEAVEKGGEPVTEYTVQWRTEAATDMLIDQLRAITVPERLHIRLEGTATGLGVFVR